MTAIEKPDVIGATRRAETIRSGMVGYAAAMEAIGEAFEARDWIALGHKNWDEYCEKEFSEKRLKLTQQQREQAVLAFRGAGMSIRAIGSALGLPKSSVADTLSQVSEPGHLPAEVKGADGKTYTASRPAPQTAPADVPEEDHSGSADPGEVEDRESSTVGGASTPSDAQPSVPSVLAGGIGEATGTGVASQHSEPVERQQGRAGVPAPAAAPGKTFDEVLDEFVPDGDPHRLWRSTWLKAIKNAWGPASFAVADIAANGDDNTFAALIDIRDFYDELLTKVQAERIRIAEAADADLPDNVRPIRRTA